MKIPGFITMVVNCAVQVEHRPQKIGIVVKAADIFMEVRDISVNLQEMLPVEVPVSQARGRINPTGSICIMDSGIGVGADYVV